MARFVHLTPRAHAARVRKTGIRAARRGPTGTRGIYCFPVLPSYTLTHQWLRELSRRSGPRDYVAVHVRLPDDESVTVGPYAWGGRDMPVATTTSDAVRRIAALEDPRGWEVFVPRAVTRLEVHRIRAVRQVTGWRYFPEAHGVTPCVCDGCRVRGEYGARRLRERRPHPGDGPPPPPRVLLRRIEEAVASGRYGGAELGAALARETLQRAAGAAGSARRAPRPRRAGRPRRGRGGLVDARGRGAAGPPRR